MNLDNHRQITREGCSPTLDATQIDIVVNANLQEDDLQGLSSVHFDNCAFSEGAAKIRENRASIRQHSDRLSPSALTAFGRLLHTVQDFYAHSNWIELFQDRSPIPLWNIDVSTLPAGIHSGTWKEGNPKRCAATVPSHATMNKDKHSSPRGKTTVDHGPNRGKTLFDLAYDAALRATQAELKWFFSDVTCYRITVVTGDVDRAGTDANVFIVLTTSAMTTSSVAAPMSSQSPSPDRAGPSSVSRSVSQSRSTLARSRAGSSKRCRSTISPSDTLVGFLATVGWRRTRATTRRSSTCRRRRCLPGQITRERGHPAGQPGVQLRPPGAVTPPCITGRWSGPMSGI